MNATKMAAVLMMLGVAAVPAAAQNMDMSGRSGGMMDAGMMQMCHAQMGGDMDGGMMKSGDGAMKGHAGMMAASGMAGMDHAMMEGSALLFGGVDLGLTSDQQTKLDDLVGKARSEHRAHMQAAMAVRSGATEALAGADPDVKAYERSLKEAATHMVQAQMVMAEASVEARGLLTPEQLAKLPEGAQLMNSMMCGMMGAGMMDHAAMMGGKPGSEGHDQHHR